jgi:hypothetical protein
VVCAAFSPDGGHIASSSRDAKVTIWDTRGGKKLRQFLAHQGFARRRAFGAVGVGHLFRRHVVRRAQHNFFLGQRRGRILLGPGLQAGEPEIEHLDDPLYPPFARGGKSCCPPLRRGGRGGEQQVQGFDVAVDQAALEGVLQAQGGLPDEVAGRLDRQGALSPHQLFQVGARGVFHDEEVGVAHLIGFVGADDVGMRQASGRLDLAPEAAHGVGAGQPLLADDLDGHHPPQFLVAGLEDLAHAAGAQPCEEDIRPQHQVLAAALEQLVDLVGGEPIAVDQLLGQGARLGKVGLTGAADFFQLPRLQNPALAKGRHQVGNGGQGGGNVAHRKFS